MPFIRRAEIRVSVDDKGAKKTFYEKNCWAPKHPHEPMSASEKSSDFDLEPLP